MPRIALLLVLAFLMACTPAVDSRVSGDGGASVRGEQARPGLEPTPTTQPVPTAEPIPSPEPTGEPPTEPAGDPPPQEGPGCEAPACYGEPVRIGLFDAEVVPEASGLAVSALNPEVLYLLDDRPGTSEVWAVRRDGEMLGAVGVAGLDARDTESLAVGVCGSDDERTCLYVGDIGDNRRSRDHITVHRVVEPELTGGVPAEPLPADAVRLRYPDGPHDAEAMFVDDEGMLYIVTKATFDRETRQTGATHLYRTAFADGELELLGELDIPQPPGSLHAQLVGHVVTGADAVAGHVVLRTYDQVLSLRGEDLVDLPSWELRSVPSPFEMQSEAIALDTDGCSYLTVGEMAGDIWFVECRS